MFFPKSKRAKKGPLSPILYSGYKKTIPASTELVSVADENKIFKNKKKTQKCTRKSRNMSFVIAVGNLYGSICSTHVAKALENYICGCIENSVLAVKANEMSYTIYIDQFNKHKVVIIDCGDMKALADEWKGEFKRADIHIINSFMTEEYLNSLADYIQLENIRHHTFLFNQVPSSKFTELDALMEDYEHYCLPVFDSYDLDKDVKQMFKKILRGKL